MLCVIDSNTHLCPLAEAAKCRRVCVYVCLCGRFSSDNCSFLLRLVLQHLGRHVPVQMTGATKPEYKTLLLADVHDRRCECSAGPWLLPSPRLARGLAFVGAVVFRSARGSAAAGRRSSKCFHLSIRLLRLRSIVRLLAVVCVQNQSRAPTTVLTPHLSTWVRGALPPRFARPCGRTGR